VKLGFGDFQGVEEVSMSPEDCIQQGFVHGSQSPAAEVASKEVEVSEFRCEAFAVEGDVVLLVQTDLRQQASEGWVIDSIGDHAIHRE